MRWPKISNLIHLMDMRTYFPLCANTEQKRKLFEKYGFMIDPATVNCPECKKHNSS